MTQAQIDALYLKLCEESAKRMAYFPVEDLPPYTPEQLRNHVADPRIHAVNMRQVIAQDCEEECLEAAKSFYTVLP